MTWTTHRLRLTTGAVLIAMASPAAVSIQPPTIADVLARAAVYVADVSRELAGIVAEERYVQTWTRTKGTPPTPDRRMLLSDLMLVRPEGAMTWIQYRDVFEVDGMPIRDRAERLKLQLERMAEHYLCWTRCTASTGAVVELPIRCQPQLTSGLIHRPFATRARFAQTPHCLQRSCRRSRQLRPCVLCRQWF